MNSFSATVSATVPTISASVSTISAIINSPILKLILMITHHTINTFLSEDISPNNGYFIAPVSLSWSRIVVQVIHVTGLIAVSVARLIAASGNVASISFLEQNCSSGPLRHWAHCCL